jgi:hypothetical protein
VKSVPLKRQLQSHNNNNNSNNKNSNFSSLSMEESGACSATSDLGNMGSPIWCATCFDDLSIVEGLEVEEQYRKMISCDG